MACPFPVSFPSWVYHPNGSSKVVRDVFEFEALGPEWGDTPFVIPDPVVYAPVVFSNAELQVAELSATVDTVNAKNHALTNENADLRQKVLARDQEISELKGQIVVLEGLLAETRQVAESGDPVLVGVEVTKSKKGR